MAFSTRDVSLYLCYLFASNIIFSQWAFGQNEHTHESRSATMKNVIIEENPESSIITDRSESGDDTRDMKGEEFWRLDADGEKVADGNLKSRKQDVDNFSDGGKKDVDGKCDSCVEYTTEALKRDLSAEVEERKALKKVLDTYTTDLHDLRSQIHGNGTLFSSATAPLRLTAKGSVSFFAKLSHNRELKPLDTIVFNSVLSNQGQGYNPDTGAFTAPLAGTYMFFSTVLSGYNTKVETAILANDKEITRIYSGAHDAHGSGSNMAILDLHANDVVRVRLLYQGGNHVHGYYSTFSGALLTEKGA